MAASPASLRSGPHSSHARSAAAACRYPDGGPVTGRNLDDAFSFAR